jgi:hypothetical protein
LLLDMVLTGPRSSASLSMLVFSRRSFTSTKIPLMSCCECIIQ